MRSVGVRFAATAVVAVLGVLLTACGGGSSGPRPAGTNIGQPTPTGPPPSPGGGHDMIGGSVTNKLGTKPAVVVPKGTPPTKLLTRDVVAGTGAVAGEKSTVTAQLVGVHWTNGQSFYASWDKPGSTPDTFSLRDVIPGFAKGVSGMRAGGRREIVMPPDLAYGSKGSGQVGPNETLVFVVDLLTVT